MPEHRPTKPKRQRSADRVLHRDVTATQIKCDFALAPFDRASNEMDHRWGIDRLVELVPPEMASKYGSAMAKLNQAIDDQDPDEIALRASVCIRGMHAMNQIATQTHGEPPTAHVWLIQADGYTFGLMRDSRAWQRAQEAYPGLELITEREMVLALSMYRASLAKEMIDAAKAAFPGAEVTAIRNRELEDDISF